MYFKCSKSYFITKKWSHKLSQKENELPDFLKYCAQVLNVRCAVCNKLHES